MPGLRWYVAKRAARSFLVIAVLVTLTFYLARVAPSDPAALWIGGLARPEQLAKARTELGLDKPLYIQYVIYMRDLFSGNWGISFRTHRPVVNDIIQFLPASIELAFFAQILATVIGVPAGVMAASRKDSRLDNILRLFSVGGVSIPIFWLGLLFQLIFARYVGLLPLEGRLSQYYSLIDPVPRVTGFLLIDTLLSGKQGAFADALRHLILPAAAVAAYPMGLAVRMLRSSMIEVLNEKYILTARAFGIPKNIIRYVYAFRNALVPTLMVEGLTFAYTLTGIYLIEVIFNWPGLGTYIWRAILAVDHTAIIGTTIVIALVYITINFVLDVAQVIIDPRVKL